MLHELVTSAVKYGALSNAAGRLSLSWTSAVAHGSDIPELHLCWVETDGPLVRPSKHQGFGSRLIRRSIEGELAGRLTVDFAPEGVTYVIVVPL